MTAIFDILHTALVWAMGLVLDREPQTGEAYRLLSLLVFAVVATWLSLYWRSFVLRSRTIRRKLLPDERYAGQYLQAVQRGDEIRYAIVRIFYNNKRGRFEAHGRNYTPSGEEISSFKSKHIVFPAGKENTIEFIWQGKRPAAGYTCMKIDSSDQNYIEGDGYIIAFGQSPRTFPIRFKYLHGRHVRQALGIDTPAHPEGETRFIRKFHAELGDAVRRGFENSAEEVT